MQDRIIISESKSSTNDDNMITRILTFILFFFQDFSGRIQGLMIKDLEVAIEEAAKFGARLPMVELIRDNALSTSGLEHPMGQPL